MTKKKTQGVANNDGILFIDIETLPNVGTFWNPGHKVTLSYDNILDERRIICVSWKWGNNRAVETCVANICNGRANDINIIKRLYKVLLKARCVVGHNINKFDIPYIRGRGLIQGLPPIPVCTQIDTYRLAKSKFYLNSYRLDYLAKVLGIGTKIKTDYNLWKQCLFGNAAAIKKMVCYNKRDVVLLEKVYNRLKPYDPNRQNKYATKPQLSPCCSSPIRYEGTRRTKTMEYRRFVCLNCFGWGRERKGVILSPLISL